MAACLPVTIAVVLAFGVPGCRSTGVAVDMWVVEPVPVSERLATGLEGPKISPTGAELAGAINETISFRFAVRVADAPIGRPGLRVTPFRSIGARIDPSVVQMFRMHRVAVADFPGWHIRSIPPHKRVAAPLDVLVPLRAPRGGLPTTLAAGETYDFWVDISIPKGTFEGSYTAKIEITSDGSAIGALDLRLTVWPVILPDEADIPIIAELDHRQLFRHHIRSAGRLPSLSVDDWRDASMRAELDALLRSTLRMLQSHRLTPVLHKLAPLVHVDAHGAVEIDWGQYDAVVEPCLSGQAFFNRVPQKLWPLPFHSVFSSTLASDRLSSPTAARLLREYLIRCSRHFEHRGWLDRSYALLPEAVSVTAESVEATRDFAAAARSADRRIAIVSRLWPQDMGPYGWVDYSPANFSKAVDIWLPPAQFYDRRTMAEERAAGRRTWLAVDRPPFSGSLAVCAPPAYVRVLVWQAERLEAEALHIGCVNRWPDAADLPASVDCVRVDPGVLLYPGRPFGLDEPVASVRLKRLRRASQDAAYRRLLSEHGLEHVGEALGRSLAPYAGSDAFRTHFADGRPIGWIDDPMPFDLARDIMAEELIKDVSGGQTRGRLDEFVRSATWRRFMLATRRLHLSVDGTRMRLTGSRTTFEADIECALTIANRTRVPVTGIVRFIDLPDDWSAPIEGRSVAPIAPNSSRRVVLTAHARSLPITSCGFVRLPIELTTEDGRFVRCQARASCITGVPFDAAVRIDGDLSDWPLGAGNVAADFRLLAPPPANPAEEHTTHPRRATLGFVMRDRDYLYVAVNCSLDAGTAPLLSRRNVVDYDDLVPVGTELVEVLIDPLNAGTRSPADLYHIAVKPSGTHIAEKGVRFDPPCGPRQPWPADIDVATGLFPDRWIAELRIPLAAFEMGTAEHTIWGFNITRFDASRREFSTWSGASGNAYDPLSLGNLHLP